MPADVSELVSVDREVVLGVVVPPDCRRARISGGTVALIAALIKSSGMLRAVGIEIAPSEILEICISVNALLKTPFLVLFVLHKVRKPTVGEYFSRVCFKLSSVTSLVPLKSKYNVTFKRIKVS